MNTSYFIFKKFVTFDFAIAFLQKNLKELFVCSIDWKNLTIIVVGNNNRELIFNELSVHQIWDKPSFKGPSDFTIVKVSEFQDITGPDLNIVERTTEDIDDFREPVACEMAREAQEREDSDSVLSSGWPGDGSGMDDLADFNANEESDYREE